MNELIAGVQAELAQSSSLELTAVLLAIAYLLLAVRQQIACWYAAFVSTALFLYVFWQVSLYMESALQVYYLGMAVYGWYTWRKHAGQDGQSAMPIQTWSARRHAVTISIILTATLVSGYLLQGTDQRLAYVDSFTTWGAVVTTYMVARKVLENWIYWLVIDSVAIYLYLDRSLFFTALLFACYLVIILFGFNVWWRDYKSQAAS